MVGTLGKDIMLKSTKAKRHTVLCVEDDANIRPLLGFVLRRAGFEVSEAATCAEAKHVLQQRPPSLVILDVDLPDGNGFDLAKEWHNEGHTGLPILFITGGESRSRQRKAVELNGGFLPKPFNHLALLAAVDSLLRIM